MLRIHVRKLLTFTTEQLLEKLNGDFELIFDNGQSVVTNERETCYSSFIWELFRKHPDAQIRPEHHLAAIRKNGTMSSSSHLRLLQAAMSSVFDAYRVRAGNDRKLTADLGKMAYEITNHLYNVLTQHCEEYVTGLDCLSFLEIGMDKELRKKIATVPSTEDGMSEVQDHVRELLYRDPRYKNNEVSLAIRRGISREGQLLQIVGMRGFCTDMNSEIFHNPVRGNYLYGIRLLSESMIESRSASKALGNAERPLQDSEYFSRRQQLIGMNLSRLTPGDCGSQNYLMWQVRDVQMEGETQVLGCDLDTIFGKWYLDEETNQLRVIGKNDRHLIGKTIKIRDPVAGCALPDPYAICETCFGTGSRAVTEGANIGHASVVELTAPVGQNILSTKHHEGSSKLEPVVLRALEKVYLNVNDGGTYFSLSPGLKNKKIKIHVRCQDVPGMPDVVNSPSSSTLSPFRVSKFEGIFLEIANRNGSELIPLETRAQSRLCSLSGGALEHIRLKGYTIETDSVKNESRYVIDMDGWDMTKPLFVLPMSHYNMSHHQSEIAKLLESTTDEMFSRSELVSPEKLLVEFHDLVNRRLKVNLGVLSPILLASMVISANEGRYDIPKAFTRRGVGVMRVLLSSRSLSGTMAFQDHHNVLVRPASFLATNRPNHPFDPILMPSILNNPKIRDQYRN